MKIPALVVLIASVLPTLHATPIAYDLRDTTKTAEIELGIITRSGVTATLAPFVNGVAQPGTLNQTASTFGINALAAGDATDLLDGGAGAEWIAFSFDTNVYLTNLTLSMFSGTEQAMLTIGSNPSINLTDTGSSSDGYSFAANNFISAGQTIVLKWVSGNGFSFDNFTIEPAGPAVPESFPTLPGLLCIFGMLIFSRRFVSPRLV